MCGIGAVFGKSIGDGESTVKKSLDAIRHRGYSHDEIAAGEDCALGANRLEIVDSPNARQPQTNEDRTIFAVFNGEIFNHNALRQGLAARGHVFRTASDTEVLAHLYEEHGPGMVKMLDSEMFAFFIYDRRRNSFFAARDRYGVKPLYHALDSSGNRHFASEIKQLSQFEDIRRIDFFPPGHFMLDGRLTRYYSIPGPGDKMPQRSEAILPRLRSLFDSAVKKRADTDLPLCVFLSGGVDSTSVLATARKFHDSVTAITVGLPGSQDLAVSKKYCSENGIRHLTFRPPSEKELVLMLPKFVRITESFEPHVLRYAAVNYFIAEFAAKSGFRVVLSGDGAEEIFAGYTAFDRAKDYAEVSRMLYLLETGLHRMQFQRVDRISMFHTLEVRVPFFDTDFADYAIRIPSELKIRDCGGRRVEKWIWREAMRDRLPSYIADRGKSVLTEGAGYGIGEASAGMFHEAANESISDRELAGLRRAYPDWNITDKETAYYFRMFLDNGYAKAEFSKDRPYIHRSRLSRLQALVSRVFRL